MMNSRTSGSGGATRPTLLGVLLGLRVVTRVSWLIEPVTLELANAAWPPHPCHLVYLFWGTCL